MFDFRHWTTVCWLYTQCLVSGNKAGNMKRADRQDLEGTSIAMENIGILIIRLME